MVIYGQWLYIVLEHSTSPSPHKMISHHVDDVIIQALCSGLLIFFKNVPGVLNRTKNKRPLGQTAPLSNCLCYTNDVLLSMIHSQLIPNDLDLTFQCHPRSNVMG